MLTKTVVINLVRRPDRRAEMSRELKRVGWEAEFFPAAELMEANGFPSRGARGCFISHLLVLRAAVADKVDRLILLEDDLNFSKDFAERWRAIRLPDDFALCYPAAIEAIPLGVSAVPGSTGLRCTHFMIFNGAALPTVVAGLETILNRPPGHPSGGPMHVDGAYSTLRAQNPDLKTVAIGPPLGYQRPSRTDIGKPRWFDRVGLLAPAVRVARRIKQSAPA